MNHKSNRRIQLTRQMMKDALLTLLNSDSLSNISVSDLCKTADLNRSTFYAHYHDTTELLVEIENDIITRFPVVLNIQADEYNIPVNTLLNYFSDNKATLPLLLKRDASFRNRLLSSAVDSYISLWCTSEKAVPAENLEKLKNHLSFIAAGSLHLVEKWLSNELDMTAEELIDNIYEFSGNVAPAVLDNKN